MKKIVFPTIHLEPSTRAVPLAAACLKAVLVGYDTVLMDFFLDDSPRMIRDKILQESPDAVGFPVYLWNRSLVLKVISELHSENPNLFLIAGGPEVTASPGNFMSDCTCLDAAVQGEGEPVIQALLDALLKDQPIPDLPGIWTPERKDSRLVYVPDLNAIESPLLSGAVDLTVNTGLLWELARGCPFACDFCFESKGSGKIRTISLDRIEAELDLIEQNEVQQVFVLDPTFNINKKRVLSILELIRSRTPHTYFYFEVRSEFLDEEMVAAFSGISCTLQVGLQSSSEKVLGLVNRTINQEKFSEKMELLNQYGISFGLDLIYGLPGDSLEGFCQSLNFALNQEPNHLDIFPLAVLPGTVLYDNAEKLGVQFQKQDPYTVIETSGFSQGDLSIAADLAKGADLIYNRGKAVSWLSRVCRDLDLFPSDLIRRWVSFLQTGTDFSVSPYSQLSNRIQFFLESLYLESGLPESSRVIRDMIRYLNVHYFMDEVEETTSPLEESVEIHEESRFQLHSSVYIESFQIDPDDLIQNYSCTTEELTNFLNEEKTWIYWSREWEICHDILEWDRKALLEQLSREIVLSDIQIPDGRNRNWVKETVLESLLEGYLIQKS